MKKILVVYAHPNSVGSRMNRALIQSIENLEFVTISSLYDKYPDGKIDIFEEQKLILENDLIVLQFPFYWFNTTPLMKQWIDEVFARGFAYGNGGDKLQDKDLMVAISIGSSKERYDNQIGFTLPELLKPFEHTAEYCGMKWRDHFVVADPAMNDDVLKKQAQQYRILMQNYAMKIERVGNEKSLSLFESF